MKTTLLTPLKSPYPELSPAVSLLERGETVAIPTETVYGLAADAFNPAAVRKIFQAKGRPSDNPLIVHVTDKPMLLRVVDHVPPAFQPIIDAFWPGPLTLLFPKSDLVPMEVTAGLPTVAVRMPSHPVARHLIGASKCPLAAPSANTSGRPSPTLASHVLHDLHDCIPCIVDGGPCDKGIESTVLNLLSSPPLILRPGSITLEMLRSYVPNLEVYQPSKKALNALSDADPALASHYSASSFPLVQGPLPDSPLAPGMKYIHYAPQRPLFLIDSPTDQKRYTHLLECLLRKAHDLNLTVGLIGPSQPPSPYTAVCHPLVNPEDPEELARELFGAFRSLDDARVDFIIMRSILPTSTGLAVMNRAYKAASHVIAAEPDISSSSFFRPS